jgi:Domain of unknown function (DUF4337)
MAGKKFSMAAVKKLAAHLAATDKSAKSTTDDGPPWIGHVAMLTGVLAALAGVLTVRSTSLTNDAIYQSNQAILAQTQASDAWAEYQADSVKARVVEMQMLPSSTISTADRNNLEGMDNDLRERQPKAKQTAADKESERDDYLKKGLGNLAEKDLLGCASLAAQLGIALASVAALVKNRSVFHLGVAVGVIGLGIAGYALMGHLLVK